MKKKRLARYITNKLRSKGGFSLIELLAATVVLVLIASALSVGIPVTLDAYEKVTATSEATVLLSTLSQSLANELRYAKDIQLQSSDHVTLATFTSSVYGRLIKPVCKDGEIQMANTTAPEDGGDPITTYYPLLSQATYTNNLAASMSAISYTAGVFHVSLSIYLPAGYSASGSTDKELAALEFNIRSVNE